jgi:hypothetical protein
MQLPQVTLPRFPLGRFGMAVLPPWQKLSNFSVRAENADIDPECRQVIAN